MDFLFHVMTITTFIDHTGASCHNYSFTVGRGTITEENINAISADKRIVMIFEIDHLARQMRKRRGIRANIRAIFTKAYGQGWCVSRNHDNIREIFDNGGKGISPINFRQNLLHGLTWIKTCIKSFDK